MPAVVRKRGARWAVISHKGKGGKVLGRHKTKYRARRQQRAVNASLQRRGKI